MKILIAYYSKTGNNKLLAEYLQKEINGDIEAIMTPRPYTGMRWMLKAACTAIMGIRVKINTCKHLHKEYDTVVLCCPIRCKQVASPMLTYIKRYKAVNVSYAFISVCGGATWKNKRADDRLQKTLWKKLVASTQLLITSILPKKDHYTIKETMNVTLDPTAIKKFSPDITQFIKKLSA